MFEPPELSLKVNTKFCAVPSAPPPVFGDTPVSDSTAGAGVHEPSDTIADDLEYVVSCACIQIFFTPPKLDLNVTASLSVSVVPAPEAEDAPRSMLHWLFWTTPA